MSAKSYIVIICLLASIGLVWQFIIPAYDEIKERGPAIERKSEEARKLEEWVGKLSALNASYQAKQEEISKLYKMIPEDKDVPNALNWLDTLNFQTGMILSSVDFTEGGAVETSKTASSQPLADIEQSEISGGMASFVSPEPKQIKLKELIVNFSSAGNYDAFMNLLMGLENNIRLTDIQSISFSSQAEASDIFDFTVRGKMYYR